MASVTLLAGEDRAAFVARQAREYGWEESQIRALFRRFESRDASLSEDRLCILVHAVMMRVAVPPLCYAGAAVEQVWANFQERARR